MGGTFLHDQFLFSRVDRLDLEKPFGAIEPLSQKNSGRMKSGIPAEHSGISGTYPHTQCVCMDADQLTHRSEICPDT